MTGDPRREAVNAARRRGQLDLEELWLRYVALGGDAAPLELEAYLLGIMPLDDYQYDILAQVLNERLRELGLPPDVPSISPWSSSRRGPADPGDQPEGPREPDG